MRREDVTGSQEYTPTTKGSNEFTGSSDQVGVESLLYIKFCLEP